MTDELNDRLDDIFGGPLTANAEPKKTPPAHYVPNKAFIEGCKDCRGTGWWRPGYRCFKCKGAGKLQFKTSPEARQKERDRAAQKKAAEAVERANDMLAFTEAHKEIWNWILNNSDSFEFAASMRDALIKFGSLTPGQLAACQRCLDRNKAAAEQRRMAAEARAAAAPVVDTAGIDRLKVAFDKAIAYSAEKGLKLSPRITVNGMTISPAKSTSANPGALYVKNSTTYLGKIKDGKFFSVRECSKEQEAEVLKFIADPAEAAKVYGQTTGTCCICNATLRSEWKHRGIGPICAEKFGWA